MPRDLVARVREVEGQREVYDADLRAALEANAEDPHAAAVEGVAHHVFNTLRGAEDDADGSTFDDVRSIIAESF